MKIILCILLLISTSSKADPIKFLMSVSPTVNLIVKHLNIPAIPIMMENRDGSPLIRAGIQTPNSIVFVGSTQFAEYPILSETDGDILKHLKPIAYIGKISFVLVTSSKTHNTIEDIVNIAKTEHRSIRLGGNGFNNICHFSTVFLTKKYGVEFEFIEYKKTPQLDVDIYNQLIDVSCKFSNGIEDETRRKYYNIIANFSKNDRTGSLKTVPIYEELPDLSSAYMLFGNINTTDTELIINSIKNVKTTEWFSKNHIFLDINTNQDFIKTTIMSRRVDIYNLIKSDSYFNKKIKSIPEYTKETP